MSGRLHGKVAIVTGAASVFGRAIAETFAAEGAKVVVADLNSEVRVPESPMPSDQAPLSGRRRHPQGDVDAMVGAALERFGGLDVAGQQCRLTHQNRPLMR